MCINITEHNVAHLDLIETLRYLYVVLVGCRSGRPQSNFQLVDAVRRGIRDQQDRYRLHQSEARPDNEHEGCRGLGQGRAAQGIAELGSREYDGAEYTAVRNKLIALFVLSATGCLSPFTLIIASVLIVRKNLMDIDYNRLSSTMKAIVFSAAAVSALLMFILVLTLVFD